MRFLLSEKVSRISEKGEREKRGEKKTAIGDEDKQLSYKKIIRFQNEI